MLNNKFFSLDIYVVQTLLSFFIYTYIFYLIQYSVILKHFIANKSYRLTYIIFVRFIRQMSAASIRYLSENAFLSIIK